MYEEVKPLVTALITAAVTIVGIATPLVVAWLRRYFSIRESAAMSAMVTAAASREGAMLLSQVPDLKTVSIGSEPLLGLAQHLVSHYPEYCDKLGIDIERAEGLVLGEAHKLYNTGFVPSPALVSTPSQSIAMNLGPRP